MRHCSSQTCLAFTSLVLFFIFSFFGIFSVLWIKKSSHIDSIEASRLQRSALTLPVTTKHWKFPSNCPPDSLNLPPTHSPSPSPPSLPHPFDFHTIFTKIIFHTDLCLSPRFPSLFSLYPPGANKYSAEPPRLLLFSCLSSVGLFLPDNTTHTAFK